MLNGDDSNPMPPEQMFEDSDNEADNGEISVRLDEDSRPEVSQDGVCFPNLQGNVEVEGYEQTFELETVETDEVAIPDAEKPESDAKAEPQEDSVAEADAPRSPDNEENDDTDNLKPSTSNHQAGLLEDIFGNSDSEDEFEGFSKKKFNNKALGSDDEDEDKKPEEEDAKSAHGDEEGEKMTTTIEAVDDDGLPLDGPSQDLGLESSEDEALDRPIRNDIVYDFDLMMQKKREENHKKRKRRNIDIINDSDDVIAELIGQMKQAADEDFEFNRDRKPALCKIKLLPRIESALKKIDLREAFLDAGILGVITDWLTPLPDRSLPNIKVRETMLSVLHTFNVSDSERLKASGIGKAVMYLSKHPKESKENKTRAKNLISKWARFIFNLEADFHSVSREEREDRDREHISRTKRRRSDSTSESSATPKGKDEANRPGSKGWIPRARVPQASNRDYVNRPRSTVEIENERMRGSSKKSLTRLELMQRSWAERKKANKSQRAVHMSMDGKRM
ncbi:Protein IWS1 -like protein [Halotydeus destructor]|nr:Protein IWS1 -like protein [Halotydeus destructor]